MVLSCPHGASSIVLSSLWASPASSYASASLDGLVCWLEKLGNSLKSLHKATSTCPQSLRALPCVEWHFARDAYLGVQKFNDVVTTCSFFSEACSIESGDYTVLLLKYWPDPERRQSFLADYCGQVSLCYGRKDARA